MTPTRLGITWQLSDSHGWGVFGLNLALQLIERGETTPLLFGAPNFIDTPPKTLTALQPFINEQRQVQARVLEPAGDNVVNVDGVTVLHALANQFRQRNKVRGAVNIGFIFFEQGGIDADALDRAKAYNRILAGSSWNRDYALRHGVTNIEFVAQGINPDVFHPGPPSGAYRNRFTITLIGNHITQTTLCVCRRLFQCCQGVSLIVFDLIFLLKIVFKGSCCIKLSRFFSFSDNVNCDYGVVLCYRIDYGLPLSHTTKNRVFAIEPRGFFVGDKKLTSICARTCICH